MLRPLICEWVFSVCWCPNATVPQKLFQIVGEELTYIEMSIGSSKSSWFSDLMICVQVTAHDESVKIHSIPWHIGVVNRWSKCVLDKAKIVVLWIICCNFDGLICYCWHCNSSAESWMYMAVLLYGLNTCPVNLTDNKSWLRRFQNVCMTN